MNTKMLKPAIVLFLICAVASVVLAFVNKVTSPAIKAYEEKVVLQAFMDVAGDYELGERTDYDDQYINCSYQLIKNNSLQGYVLDLKANGYGGEMNFVARYDLNGVIKAAKMVSNSETPGIGKKSENPEYMKIFCDKIPVPTNKNMLSPMETVIVSGASMTFGGVSKALNYGSEFIKDLNGGK